MADQPGLGPDDLAYWEQRDIAANERAKFLVENKGYEPWDARAIVNRQEQEVRMRHDAGQAVEPLVRSIELDPSTTRVLPEAKLRQLEQQQAGLVPQSPEQSAPEIAAPELSAAARTRAPNRYALLVEKHDHPERAAEIDQQLQQRQKGLGRDAG